MPAPCRAGGRGRPRSIGHCHRPVVAHASRRAKGGGGGEKKGLLLPAALEGRKNRGPACRLPLHRPILPGFGARPNLPFGRMPPALADLPPNAPPRLHRLGRLPMRAPLVAKDGPNAPPRLHRLGRGEIRPAVLPVWAFLRGSPCRFFRARCALHDHHGEIFMAAARAASARLRLPAFSFWPGLLRRGLGPRPAAATCSWSARP